MAYLTEKELIDRFHFYTLQLEKLLDSGEDFFNLTNKLPLSAHINDRESLVLLDFNRKGEEYTNYSKAEIVEMGMEFFEKHMHPHSLHVDAKKLLNFYAEDEPDDIFCYIQYLQLFGNEEEYQPLITFTKICKSDPSRVFAIDLQPHQLGKLSKKMEFIVEMDLFKLEHFKRFQRLTPREKEILTLLANGENNPAIADRLVISRQTVETHRKNINRKLGIRCYRDVVDYSLAFDLIKI